MATLCVAPTSPLVRVLAAMGSPARDGLLLSPQQRHEFPRERVCSRSHHGRVL